MIPQFPSPAQTFPLNIRATHTSCGLLDNLPSTSPGHLKLNGTKVELQNISHPSQFPP